MPVDSGSGTAPQPRTEGRADLYLRDGIPAALVDTIEVTISRVARLEETDAVAEYRVRQWPPAADGDAGSGDGRSCRRDRVGRFEEWASAQGCSLEPGFEVRAVTAGMIGRAADYERVSVPLLTLAYYESGELTGVAPYSDGPRRPP